MEQEKQQHEAYLQRRREKYQLNKERVLVQSKEYYQKNREKVKKYYIDNKEKRLNYANERYRKLKAKQSAVGTHEICYNFLI